MLKAVLHPDHFTIRSTQDDSMSTNVQYTFETDNGVYISAPKINGNNILICSENMKLTVCLCRFIVAIGWLCHMELYIFSIGKVIVEATSHDPNGNYDDVTIELPIDIERGTRKIEFAENPINVVSGSGSVVRHLLVR